MNFHWPFFGGAKSAPSPVRFVIATRAESRKARTARAMKELELGIAIARLTPEERAEAIARAKSPRATDEKVRG